MTFLENYKVYAIYMILLLALFNGCNSCRTSKKISGLQKEVDTLHVELNTLKTAIYSKEHLDKRLRILSLENSKNILYSWNAVVRTTARPDDLIQQWDNEIKKLRDEIE